MARKQIRPTKEELEAQRIKELKMLEASNQMYEKTRKEAEIRGKKETLKETLELIDNAQDDVKTKLSQYGADKKNFISFNSIEEDENQDSEDIFSIIEKTEKKEEEEQVKTLDDLGTRSAVVEEHKYDYNSVYAGVDDSTAAFDMVPLPSNGECYKNKITSIPVSYLTAADENVITSPNLYRDGSVIDILLHRKVMDKEFDVDSLINGDVDQIILFLRATSYGVEFPVTVTDPNDGSTIETNIDLSQIKSKEFTLKGDENGYFDFVLPHSKKKVKFKYLTRKEEKALKKVNENDNKLIVAGNVRYAKQLIESALQADDVLDSKEKGVVFEFNKELEKWSAKLSEKKRVEYNKAITNRMEMQIVSIDGITDRKQVKKLIEQMPANDSLQLRKYILENEPGVNFEVEIQRPESKGGGSFKTFLEWDDSIFLNIA